MTRLDCALILTLRSCIPFMLALMLGLSFTPPAMAASDSFSYCITIADHASRNELDRLAIKPTAILSKENAELLMGKYYDETLEWGADIWQEDLNNDGIKELLVHDIQGTGRVSNGIVFPTSHPKSFQPQSIDQDEQSLFFLSIDGHFFVVSGDNKHRLGTAWKFGENNQFEAVCIFIQEPIPERTLIKGKDVPVCLAAESGVIIPARYTLPHTIVPPDSRPLPSTYLDDLLTRIDMDNDGKAEYVTKVHNVNYSYPCSFTFLQVVNATKNGIPKNKLNDILENISDGCQIESDAFTFDSDTYIDKQSESGDREIKQIKGDTIKTLCTFEGRIINRANALQ